MSKKKKILIVILVIVALMQFKGIDKTNPKTDAKSDFFLAEHVDIEQADLIRTACYDCHSHETSYPWYSGLAPISWWLAGHIEEGREHVNFSLWAEMDADERAHALKECQEVLREKEMPILSYMLLHNEAWIDQTQREDLAQLFQSLEQ